METKFLLPNNFKKVGWLLLAVSSLFWLYVTLSSESEFSFLQTKTFAIAGSELLGETAYFTVISANLTYTIIGAIFIIGGLLVVFSKEKIEDEFIMKLRLVSFQWAFLLNYVFLLFLFIFIYGLEFFTVMVYNMFTVQVLFILRFHYLLFKNRTSDYEK